MKKEGVKHPKVWWPKTVARKWLNIPSSVTEFHSDFLGKGDIENRRRFCHEDYYGSMRECFSGLMGEVEECEVNGTLKRDPQVPTTMANTKDLRIFVGTWNVAGISPQNGLNLKDWLPTADHAADIYVLGFQEVVPLNAGNILGTEDNVPATKWVNLIHETLNTSKVKPSHHKNDKINDDVRDSNKEPKHQRYILTSSKQMVGIFLSVWVRVDLSKHVTNIQLSSVGSGILGYLGNKGSISMSMLIGNTSICFVCSHLASGEKDGDEVRRNHDVAKILQKTRFSRSLTASPPQLSPSLTILEHENVIWLGDLNYRLSSVNPNTYELLDKNYWQELLENDQLKIEKNAGRVFKGWEEGKITFGPTYKYVINSDHYVYKQSQLKDKRHTPAWCDRILWKGEKMKQLSYERGNSKFSDHRPVHSLFSLLVDLSNNDCSTNESMFRTSLLSTILNTSSFASSCKAKVLAEELFITRSQSCINTLSRYD